MKIFNNFLITAILASMLVVTAKEKIGSDCQIDNTQQIVIIDAKNDFIETKTQKILSTNEFKEKQVKSIKKYTVEDLEHLGVVFWNNMKFTYYSERVLDGKRLAIPGRQTKDGFVKDKDGYIVLASNINIPKGKVVDTPFGAKGKVYDRCSGCSLQWFDVYTR